VSLLLRSGDEGERGPGFSNVFSESIKDVLLNEGCSLFMLSPTAATEPNLDALRFAGKACYIASAIFTTSKPSGELDAHQEEPMH
jgi:hypothetical protein